MKRKLDLDISCSGGGGGANPYMSSVVGSHDASLAQGVNPWTGKPLSSRYYEILKGRQKLPVFEFKAELEKKVRDNQVVVVEGETGSGRISILLFTIHI